MFISATTAQMRELDRIAIQERGVPSLGLMENAAQAVAAAALELAPMPQRRGEDGPIASGFTSVIFTSPDGRQPTEEEQRQMAQLRAAAESKNTDPTPRIAVFCGPGNNGGDGIAAARLLLAEGYQVRIFLVGSREKMTPDAKTMEEKLWEAGGKLEPFSIDPADLSFADRLMLTWLSTCDCMVDALFGVGLKRPVAGDFRTAVRYMNSYPCPVVACDVPSGVDADTGNILGEAVRAKITVTFTCTKPGLCMGEGLACAGEVRVADIDIPHDLVFQKIHRAPERTEVHPAGSQLVLPRRPRTAHKGDFGKIFILAGSEGYTGAPVLAAKAALRTGAGLVFLGVPRDIYPIIAVKCNEAMPFPLPEDYETILEKAKGCDVALIGPGLGRAPETEKLILNLLRDLELPVVLDADGINAVSAHMDILDGRTAPTVLTPHEGEFQRLSGCELPVRDRLSAAREFAKAHRCTLVLKGHGTVTAAPGGRAWICAAGNPGMAAGGSGDVLAGGIAALLGQKHLRGPRTDLSEVVAAGVFYHAKAGDLCAQKLGEYGMLPTDMIDTLPRVLKEQEAKT